MVDIVCPDKRSEMMSGIRHKNTKPEIIVRKALFNRGYRYRLHYKGLPGKPDLVLPKYKAIIFINGCFWHRHDCHLFKWPKSNVNFWKDKITGNQKRDIKNQNALEDTGWRVMVVWECELKGKSSDDIQKRIDKLEFWLHDNENQPAGNAKQ
jgi:DNA mismatch endonuclease (patch repair protein)